MHGQSKGPSVAGLVLLVLVVTAGCRTVSTYAPATIDEVGFRERAVSDTEHGVTVTVAVPSPDESRLLFGFKTAKKRIQPVWIEITNDSDQTFWFLSHSLDPDYYSPLEVAWMGRGKYTKPARREMEQQIYARQMPSRISAGGTASGFAFVNQTLGARHTVVELIGELQAMVRFEFLVEVPGLKADYQQVDFETLYDELVDLDDQELRDWLAEQPCCTTNKDETKTGDPLNIVVIGADDAVWPAFLRAGWDVTETMTSGAMWRTIKSSVFGSRYRYSPVSALYVFGRPQDIALQKARATVDERNHLRLWLTPVTYKGDYVWIGQISRDIGVRLTTKSPTITTHKIDPEVDETRAYLLQNLAYSQGVAQYVYVGGVGKAPIDAPRGNLTGDPYFTDGLRVVLIMSADPVPINEVERLEWEFPPQR